MKIPRKITPDNIKDSVVQIVFNPACPPELVIGRFENHLQNLLEFKGGTPPAKQVFRLPDGNELNFGQFQAGVFQGGFFLDKNESVKVTVSANTLVFNTFKSYPGWEVILSVIKETVRTMFEKGITESIQRIGVRYISQFDDVAIFEKLKTNHPQDWLLAVEITELLKDRNEPQLLQEIMVYLDQLKSLLDLIPDEKNLSKKLSLQEFQNSTYRLRTITQQLAIGLG